MENNVVIDGSIILMNSLIRVIGSPGKIILLLKNNRKRVIDGLIYQNFYLEDQIMLSKIVSIQQLKEDFTLAQIKERIES
jgi:hypothetical protein